MPVAMTFQELRSRGCVVDMIGTVRTRKRWRALAPNSTFHPYQVYLSFVAQTGVNYGTRWELTGLGTANESLDIYCTQISIDEREDADGLEYYITAAWEPADALLFGPGACPENPADAPIRIEHGEWTEPTAVYRDKDGNILQNAAGDWFADTYQVDYSYPTLMITRLVRSFDPLNAATYRDSVNDAAITIRGTTYQPRVLMLKSWVATELWHQEIGRYFEERFLLLVKPLSWTVGSDSGQGWDVQLANTGYREKSGSTLVPIRDASGWPTQTPWPLVYATGAKMSMPLTAGDDMPTKTFRVRDETDFSALGFPVI